MPGAETMNGHIVELRDDVSEVKERLVAHETRFGNGREAMQQIRTDVDELKPKAPDWVKILMSGVALIGVLMGAQLWLTDRFNERPTQAQVDKMNAPLNEAQKETAKEIGNIQQSQSAQAESIKNIEAAQAAQSLKIDKILDRLPTRRSNR